MNAKELGEQMAHVIQTLDSEGVNLHPPHGGLTKREAFAMAAMQGFIAAADYQHVMADGLSSASFRGKFAAASVACADELLAELAKDQA